MNLGGKAINSVWEPRRVGDKMTTGISPSHVRPAVIDLAAMVSPNHMPTINGHGKNSLFT